jgi:hypothetical protein
MLQQHSDSIVSLFPGATETLFALGLGHRCAALFSAAATLIRRLPKWLWCSSVLISAP